MSARTLMAALAVLAACPPAASAAELYALNQGADSMSVVDTGSGSVVGTVPVGDAPFAVAVAPDGGRAYVTNVNSDSVSVVDTATRAVVDTVTVGDSPGGVAVSPDGSRVYVANGGSASVSVIDTATDAIVETIAVGASPRAVALTPDGGRAYVTSLGPDNVSVVDTSTGAVLTTIPVGAEPVAATATPDGESVYVASAFASILGGDDVSVIDTSTNAVVDTIDPNPFPFGIAAAPDGSRVYTVASSLVAIDVAAGAVVGSVPIGNGLNSIAVTHDSARVYVPSNALNSVALVDAASMTVLDRITVGSQPMGLALRPDPGPSAAFAAAGGAVEGLTAFDARRSADPGNSIARYDWDFGDGTTAPDGGPTPTHIYSRPGDYDVRLTVTNADGCSLEVVYTGQTAACNGGPKAALVRSVAVGAPAAPDCVGDSVAIGHGQATAIALSCTGAIGGVQIVSPPGHGTLSAVDQADGTVVYTPDAGFAGSDRFRFAATSAGGTSRPATIALTVGPAPTGPAPDDRTRPRLSALGLSRRAVAARVSEPATITLDVERCWVVRLRARAGSPTRLACRRVRRIVRQAGPGRLRVSPRPPLPAARYRLRVAAVDSAGNRSGAAKRFRLR